MRTRKIILGVVLLAAVAAGTPSHIPAGKIGEDVIILGALERPVGEELTIVGRKKSRGPLQNCFIVDTVDGKPVAPDTFVNIDGITTWPDGTSATIRGAEIGTLRFIQLAETNFGPDDKRWKGPHQSLFLAFKPSEIVAPKDLKFGNDK